MLLPTDLEPVMTALSAVKRLTQTQRNKIKRNAKKHAHKKKQFISVTPLKRRKKSWLASATFMWQGDSKKKKRTLLVRFNGKNQKPRLKVTGKKLMVTERLKVKTKSITITYQYGLKGDRDRSIAKALGNQTGLGGGGGTGGGGTGALGIGKGQTQPAKELASKPEAAVKLKHALGTALHKVAAPLKAAYQQTLDPKHRGEVKEQLLATLKKRGDDAQRMAHTFKAALQGESVTKAQTTHALNTAMQVAQTAVQNVLGDRIADHENADHVSAVVGHQSIANSLTKTVMDPHAQRLVEKTSGLLPKVLQQKDHEATASAVSARATYHPGDEWQLVMKLTNRLLDTAAKHPLTDDHVAAALVDAGVSEAKATRAKNVIEKPKMKLDHTDQPAQPGQQQTPKETTSMKASTADALGVLLNEDFNILSASTEFQTLVDVIHADRDMRTAVLVSANFIDAAGFKHMVNRGLHKLKKLGMKAGGKIADVAKKVADKAKKHFNKRTESTSPAPEATHTEPTPAATAPKTPKPVGVGKPKAAPTHPDKHGRCPRGSQRNKKGMCDEKLSHAKHKASPKPVNLGGKPGVGKPKAAPHKAAPKPVDFGGKKPHAKKSNVVDINTARKKKAKKTKDWEGKKEGWSKPGAGPPPKGTPARNYAGPKAKKGGGGAAAKHAARLAALDKAHDELMAKRKKKGGTKAAASASERQAVIAALLYAADTLEAGA